MSATLFINPTAMEAGLLAAAHARGLSGARAAAFERFSRTGLPHRRMEGWRWSDFRQALRAEIAPALVGDEVIAPASFSGLDAFELTIMNGQAEWEADAPAGVSVAFSEPGPLGAALEDHPFANLCAALAGPTVAIRIEDDIARPLHIRRIVGAGASHARLSLALADGASATIIESFDGVGAYFATSVTEATLGDGARLARDVLQDGSDTGAEAAIFSARLGSRAELHQMALLFGARASRMENRIEFAGPGARAELRSAAALSDQRHSDHTTHVAHKAEGCETRQLHKSALRDRSRPRVGTR